MLSGGTITNKRWAQGERSKQYSQVGTENFGLEKLLLEPFSLLFLFYIIDNIEIQLMILEQEQPKFWFGESFVGMRT